MRNLYTFIVVLLCACGGQAASTVTHVENLGTAEQPIFMPGGYGAEMGGDQLECNPPWEGNGCAVPDSKLIKVKFFASTCSPWWADRYNEVIDEMNVLLWGLGDDWGLQVTENYNYKLDCGDTTGFGSFSFKTSNTDKHSTPYGTLYQHRKGGVRLDTAAIEGHVRWGESEEGDQMFGRNVLRQEFLHTVGHGHHSHSGGPNVMDGPDNSWWEEDKSLTPEMYDRMRCYNEDSGGSDDC